MPSCVRFMWLNNRKKQWGKLNYITMCLITFIFIYIFGFFFFNCLTVFASGSSHRFFRGWSNLEGSHKANTSTSRWWQGTSLLSVHLYVTLPETNHFNAQKRLLKNSYNSYSDHVWTLSGVSFHFISCVPIFDPLGDVWCHPGWESAGGCMWTPCGVPGYLLACYASPLFCPC